MTYVAPPVPTQRSFVLIKPDAVRRGLAGTILSRFESKGLTIVVMELRQMTGELADQLYAEHVERPFYPPLRLFVTSGPSVAMVVEGDEAVDVVRTLNGATDGRRRRPAQFAAILPCPIGKTSFTALIHWSRQSVRSLSSSLISLEMRNQRPD